MHAHRNKQKKSLFWGTCPTYSSTAMDLNLLARLDFDEILLCWMFDGLMNNLSLTEQKETYHQNNMRPTLFRTFRLCAFLHIFLL